MVVEGAPHPTRWYLWLAGLTAAAAVGFCVLALAAQIVLPRANLSPGYVMVTCVVRGATTIGRPRLSVLWMPPEGLKLIPPASRPKTVCVYHPWIPTLPQSGGFIYPR